VGPRAGLDRCGKSRPTGIRSPDLPARSESLYRLHYDQSNVDNLNKVRSEASGRFGGAGWRGGGRWIYES
jgi:hypothetical protein